LYKGCENSGKHERGEQDNLHPSLRGIGLEETESNEQSSRNTETKLGENVAGHAPVLLEDTVSDLYQLLCERHGKLRCGSRIIGAGNFFVLLVLVDAFDILFHDLSQVASLPYVMPIFILVVLPSIDNFKHVLGGIFLISALAGTVVLIVVEQRARILANLTKVDCSTATGQEQQAIELLEQDSRRLMNGAKDGLTGISELSEERANCP
jgi:hypothetical protein